MYRLFTDIIIKIEFVKWKKIIMPANNVRYFKLNYGIEMKIFICDYLETTMK